MQSGVVASVVCPACGQPFLCQQQAAEGMVTCPHCAHQAARGQFATQDMMQSLAQVKRRVARTPVDTAPAVAAPMWPGQPDVPASPPPFTAPMMPAQPAFASQPEPVVWRQPPTQMSSAMLPTQTAPETPHDDPPVEFVPPHLQSSPWKRLAIAAVFGSALAAGVWVWWDMTQASALTAAGPGASHAAAPEATPEVRKASIATQTETAAVAHPPPDVSSITKDAKRLIDTLFHAATAEERAACIHEGARHAAQIEALLGPQNPAPPRLHSLGSVKGFSVALPGGQLLPLFNLGTSTCKDGALVRLIEGPDGQRRIDWPLLHETHERTLHAALHATPDAAVWAWARIVPSHGFDIPAAERDRFLSFDLHLTGEGKTPLTACVERDSPLGRFLDRETDWRQSYLARLLVRRLDFGTEATILTIADCEGTPAAETRARPQP